MENFEPNGLVTLTTDFGPDSVYVAEMKLAAWRVSPHLRVLDYTHAVAPQNIAAASWIWQRALEVFPPGTVHVGVVDPGVGTNRPIVAATCRGQIVLGPDNGLLDVIHAVWGLENKFSIEDPRYFGPRKSSTFHGRDIMVPAAAHLAAGLPPSALGTSHSIAAPPSDILANVNHHEIEGRIVYGDSFGNAVTNIFARDIPAGWNRETLSIELGNRRLKGLSGTYGDAAPGKLVVLIGSGDLLEVALVQGNATQTYGFEPGTRVRIVPN